MRWGPGFAAYVDSRGASSLRDQGIRVDIEEQGKAMGQTHIVQCCGVRLVEEKYRSNKTPGMEIIKTYRRLFSTDPLERWLSRLLLMPQGAKLWHMQRNKATLCNTATLCWRIMDINWWFESFLNTQIVNTIWLERVRIVSMTNESTILKTEIGK